MWSEFQSDAENLKVESEQLIHDLYTSDDAEELDFLQKNTVRLERTHLLIGPTGKTEAIATVKVRRGQQFFRQTVLNAYGIRCCITGINVPRLLVASHIRPWIDFPEERLQPQNGLCLSSLHDAAFDSGLITLDEKHRLILSKRLKEYFPQVALEQSFVAYEGQAIRLPNKVAEPNPDYLHYHRESVFKDV